MSSNGRTRRAPARKAAASKRPPAKAAKARAARLKPSDPTAREVDDLERQAARHQLCETRWQSLSAPGGEDEERWNSVEQHLLDRSQHRGHSERRWKYFSK